MSMTSSQRLLASLQHQEPDRVPYALSATMQPSRDMGLTIQEYFSRPEYVVEGQLRLLRKFGNDMLSGYTFAAAEAQAWGAEVIYFDEGPPNAGDPIIKRPEDILALTPPSVEDSPALETILRATASLKAALGEQVPLAGVVVSPFSLPIMQMGFASYLDLVYDRPDLLARLLAVNSEFCVAWANAQIKAGAGAIVYADPFSSPGIITRELALRYGLPTAKAVIARIEGGVMIHLASDRGLRLVDDIVHTGALGMSMGVDEDPGEFKAACRGKLALVGGLNALEMRHWTSQEAELQVKRVIARAGPGGGFVLSDSHGEIPFLVDDEVLLAIAEAVRRWGRYPLDWIGEDAA